MDIEKSVLYQGVSLTLSSKREFIRKIMGFKEVRDEILKLLQKRIGNEKLSSKYEVIDGFKRCEIYEDDFEYIFDEIIGKKMTQDPIRKRLEEEVTLWPLYSGLFRYNGEEIHFDVTNFLTYAIVKSEECTSKLYLEIEEKNLYDKSLEAFNLSEYKKQDFETNLDAREIAPSRLIRGMIALFRKEKSVELYQAIIRIIYAGYSKKWKHLKKFKSIDGNTVGMLQKEMCSKTTKSVLLGACEQIILYVIADYLGIEIEWDFQLLSMAMCLTMYENELRGEKNRIKGVPQSMSVSQKEDIRRVIEKYGTSNSLEMLLYGEGQEEKNEYLTNIMHLFHVSPRKFHEYALNTKDMITILSQKEKWNTKDYIYCMIIAIFCKYVYTLEKIVAETDMHEKYSYEFQIEKERKSLQKAESHIITQQEKMKNKELQLNKSLLEKERQIDSLVKRESDLRESLSTYEHEVKALRNYIYGLHKEWEDEKEFDIKKQENFWRDKRVVVMGGHNNWQRKLKEKFPKWQFIATDIKNFSNDLIRDKEYIVCNADFLSHASYYKMLAYRNKDQEILYVHNNNIDLCIKELCMQCK